MKARSGSSFYTAAAFAAAMVAGCSGAGSALSNLPGLSALGPAFVSPEAHSRKVPILFVADAKNHAVFLFNAKNLKAPAIGKITDGLSNATGPYGMTVDSKGNLYVVTGKGDIAVYPPVGAHRIRDISLSGALLISVAVGKDGTLASMATRGFSSDGTLYIFDKGSQTPTRTITIPIDGKALFIETAVAVDASDNVFLSVSRYPGGEGAVEEFVPGSTQPVNTNLQRGTAIGFDAKGNYYAGLVSAINVYAPGSSNPSRVITNGITAQGAFTILPNGTLFVPNIESPPLSNPGPGNVVEYAPGASSPAATLSNADDTRAYGTAYRPAH